MTNIVRRRKGRLLDAAGCLSDYARDIADMARLAEDSRRKAESEKPKITPLMYILDTDVLSNLVRKTTSPVLRQKLSEVSPELIFTSAITLIAHKFISFAFHLFSS